MHYLTYAIAAFLPTSAHAEGFIRPIPLAQTAAAEWWFLWASVALLAALLVVHMLVRRR
ncbi:hypothetical protein [Puniceibacterium sediminis]|uniref:Protein NnrT n=1 Tax=Puniceibacterium sediminis TaxID=1608407 RepID=A0A238YPI6_9RHOB|nr:hypothetical protein [Puniceibacterium sediminis]SNR73176.1 hypothetical protein SAMN06265370_11928 [Puniceibacterium sediminis]